MSRSCSNASTLDRCYNFVRRNRASLRIDVSEKPAGSYVRDLQLASKARSDAETRTRRVQSDSIAWIAVMGQSPAGMEKQ